MTPCFSTLIFRAAAGLTRGWGRHNQGNPDFFRAAVAGGSGQARTENHRTGRIFRLIPTQHTAAQRERPRAMRQRTPQETASRRSGSRGSHSAEWGKRWAGVRGERLRYVCLCIGANAPKGQRQGSQAPRQDAWATKVLAGCRPLLPARRSLNHSLTTNPSRSGPSGRPDGRARPRRRCQAAPSTAPGASRPSSR